MSVFAFHLFTPTIDVYAASLPPESSSVNIGMYAGDVPKRDEHVSKGNNTTRFFNSAEKKAPFESIT
jgi:hypothetical protein